MKAGIAEATRETEIRETVESWRRAVLAKDIDGILSHYAPDIVSFDAIAQLRFEGVEAYGKHWEACFSMCPGPTVFEVEDLDVAVGGDVAFSFCLNRCGGTGEDGELKSCWMRMTACYRKIGGRWLVVHEHFSAPFDMQSGKTLFDLEP